MTAKSSVGPIALTVVTGSGAVRPPVLSAMAGTPDSSAATAPPTVPEWVASPATFGPKLVPETTRSGAPSAKTSARPKATESPGVPSTAHTLGSGCFTVRVGALIIFVPVPL